MKEDLKKEFQDNNCMELWYDYWDLKFVSWESIITRCHAKLESLSQCDDITPLESRFIDMVSKWD